MTETPPPWFVFPDLQPNDPMTQGVVEAYVDLQWLPFWLSLGVDARTAYLDQWSATAEWHDVIAERLAPEGFDVEEDARDSAAWTAARKRDDDVHRVGKG